MIRLPEIIHSLTNLEIHGLLSELRNMKTLKNMMYIIFRLKKIQRIMRMEFSYTTVVLRAIHSAGKVARQHVLEDAEMHAVHLAAMYAQDVLHYVIHLANRSVKITQDLHV